MKIILSPKQSKFIEEIPELESLARKYIAIDRLLVSLKTSPELVEKLLQLRQDIEKLTNTLYKEILPSIINLRPEKVEQVFVLRNPELNTESFNAFMHCYKFAKTNLPLPKIVKIQRKLFVHIRELVEAIQKYRHQYNVPKNTKLVLEALQKLEGETVSAG